MDVRCVRLRPHRMEDGRLLLDIQTLIPLPEAEPSSQDRREEGGGEQGARRTARVALPFWSKLLAAAKQRTVCMPTAAGGRKLDLGSIGRRGFGLNYVIRQTDSQVEVKINGDAPMGRGLRALAAARRDRGRLRGSLTWEEPPAIGGWRICHRLDGGYRKPDADWPGIRTR